MEVWNYCCRHPVTAEAYEQALMGEGWQDDDPTVASMMGHNVGDSDDLAALADQIENAKVGAEAYRDIESEEQAAKAQSLRSRMNELAGKADKICEAFKKPHLEAGKAIDQKWMPLVKEAKGVADQLRKYIEVFKTAQLLQRRLEERQREEAARKAGEDAAPPPLPPVDTTIKGNYGRAASVGTELVVTKVTDDLALFHFLRGNPDLTQFMQTMAQKALRAGMTVPGIEIRRESKDIMTIEFKERRTFDREDYNPYIGKLGNERLQPLPNAEDVDPIEFLNHIASGGHMMQPVWGYALTPSGSNQWSQFSSRRT